MIAEELALIISKHAAWLSIDSGGCRANLAGANLAGANLAGANLRLSDLSVANLYGANLRGANLAETGLSRTDLSGANLAETDLSGANMRGANSATHSTCRRVDPFVRLAGRRPHCPPALHGPGSAANAPWLHLGC